MDNPEPCRVGAGHHAAGGKPEHPAGVRQRRVQLRCRLRGDLYNGNGITREVSLCLQRRSGYLATTNTGHTNLLVTRLRIQAERYRWLYSGRAYRSATGFGQNIAEYTDNGKRYILSSDVNHPTYPAGQCVITETVLRAILSAFKVLL